MNSSQLDFAELAVTGRPRLLALFRKLRLADIAEDLAQETLRKAWESQGGFRGDCNPHTWLHRVGFRVAQDHWRRQKANPVLPMLQDEDGLDLIEHSDELSTNPERCAMSRQAVAAIEAALDELPSSLRAMAVDMEEPVAELAKKYGTTEAAVHSRVSRLRAHLKTIVEA